MEQRRATACPSENHDQCSETARIIFDGVELESSANSTINPAGR
jgi:hypothetical protein